MPARGLESYPTRDYESHGIWTYILTKIMLKSFLTQYRMDELQSLVHLHPRDEH